MNTEIKSMIPEIEYKRARIKADVIDIALIIGIIISLLFTYKLTVENEQLKQENLELLQQSDFWCGQYNSVKGE